MEFFSQDGMMMISQWAYLYVLVTILIHVVFSIATFSDANKFKKNGESLVFVSPIVWAFAVLIGGVFVALIYWVIHHSTLRR